MEVAVRISWEQFLLMECFLASDSKEWMISRLFNLFRSGKKLPLLTYCLSKAEISMTSIRLRK